jgi:hypothetical protein
VLVAGKEQHQAFLIDFDPFQLFTSPNQLETLVQAKAVTVYTIFG